MTTAEPRLARIAAAIADPTRARVLARLLDGRLHTAGELAAHAGVTAPTMSAHLKLLVDEGLARVRPQGRHRYFGLADGDVAHALEALLRLADGREADLRRWQRPGMRDLRHARSCYGHLAGELGVRWRDMLLARGWVQAQAQGGYALTAAGRAALDELLPACRHASSASTGRVLYDCVDWSERRDHFAGPLAVAWLEAMLARGWLRRVDGSRALRLLPPGRGGLVDGGTSR